MKLGVLGDVHANIEALDEVLEQADRIGISKFLVLGDLVGYYFRPKQVIERIRQLDCYVVKGNHERLLLDLKSNRVGLDQVSPRYNKSHKRALDELNDDEFDYLNSLPDMLNFEFNGYRIRATHEAAFPATGYLYPDSARIQLEKSSFDGYDYVCVGHTHHRLHFTSQHGAQLINFGSVGQNRSYGGIAEWGYIDSFNGVVKNCSVSYEIDKVLGDIERYDNHNEHLREVLFRK